MLPKWNIPLTPQNFGGFAARNTGGRCQGTIPLMKSKRVAEVFSVFFMPKGMYSGNPASFTEQKIPIADLENLSKTVTEDEPLNEANKLSLRILERLLKGDFANGVAIDDWESGERG
jgi:hypothetical protein